MREDELAFLVFGVLHVDFHGVADGQVGIVTEFVDADHALALVADVDDDFALVDGGDGAFYDLILVDAAEALAVAFFVRGFLAGVEAVIFKGVPIELVVVDGSVALFFGRFYDHLLLDFLCRFDCGILDDLFRHC